MLPTLLAIFALLLDLVAANHVKCSWTPGSSKPSSYGFRRFCSADAEMTNAINSSFAWRCASPINDKKITVAVWDMHSHALNFETPCGNNGWNLNNEDFCNDGVDYAALCLKPEGASCLYMWRQDDCQWPDLMNLNELPSTISIWVK